MPRPKKNNSIASSLDGRTSRETSSDVNAGISTTVTPPAQKKRRKKTQFIPPKKMFMSGGSSINKYYDTIYTETCGRHGEFIVVTIEQQNGKPAYFYPLIKALSNSIDEYKQKSGKKTSAKDLVDPFKFDSRMQRNLFLRQSRNVNERINLNIPGKSLFRLGVVACPDKSNLAELNEGVTDGIHFEKLIRDEVERVMKLENKPSTKGVTTLYTPWDASKHSRSVKPMRYLDMVFTDESVENIMCSYYFQDENPSTIYTKLKEGNFNAFFSRNNGSYSQYCIDYFGFPNNCLEGKLNSDSEQSEDDDFDEDSSLVC